MLRGLIQGSSKALYRAFEHFLKNEDNEVLEEQLKTICKLYYFLMLSQCFSSKQIKTIKKFTITTLTDIFEIFASDGDAYKFTNAIIETLNFKDVSLPRTRLWEHIFHMVEEEDETEDELDAYDTLTNILSNSARLSQYSHILTRLYEDQDPELLNVIENYLNGTSIELIEEIMLKIVKENNKENNIDLNLTEIVKNDFSQEKLSIIRRL